MMAHPDKGGSETKMASVNEAYEVLSNNGMPSFAFVMHRAYPYIATELRQRYDNGDDPNDPESQQGGHPFHGSPFQFFQGSPAGSARGARGAGGGQFNFHFG
jgi:DnaJ family protein C protein 3